MIREDFLYLIKPQAVAGGSAAGSACGRPSVAVTPLSAERGLVPSRGQVSDSRPLGVVSATRHWTRVRGTLHLFGGDDFTRRVQEREQPAQSQSGRSEGIAYVCSKGTLSAGLQRCPLSGPERCNQSVKPLERTTAPR